MAKRGHALVIRRIASRMVEFFALTIVAMYIVEEVTVFVAFYLLMAVLVWRLS